MRISDWSSDVCSSDLTPDNIALRVGDSAVGYAELDRWTAKIAARLVAEGIRPGDRVGAIAGTSLAHCALLIGSVRAGALASPLSTRLSQRETGEFFEQNATRLVFTDADQVSKHSTIAGVDCRPPPIALIDGRQNVEEPVF